MAHTCKHEGISPENSQATINTGKCLQIQVNDNFTSLASDPFSIDRAVIEDNCLKLTVTYGGGCGEANFMLYRKNSVRESYPPQLQMHVTLDDKDHCKALITKDIFYDLSSLPFVEAGQTIMLHIDGYNTPVAYKK